MSKVIAVVRLAPGQVAFYDEKTGMHLTMGNPMKDVLDYMDTSRLKRAVKNKVLNLVHGSLTESTEQEIKAVEIEVKPKEVKVSKPKEVVEEIKVEAPAEVVEETTDVTEENTEEVVTEEIVEETKPKNKRKKKED